LRRTLRPRSTSSSSPGSGRTCRRSCSRTLDRVEGNARLVRGGVAEEVARLKGQPGKDLAVGGAGLASTLIRLGLVDEYRLFVSPVVLGGGTRYFPALEERIKLELVDTRTFGSRVVYVRYRRA
jgi:dihydrofolate reductase